VFRSQTSRLGLEASGTANFVLPTPWNGGTEVCKRSQIFEPVIEDASWGLYESNSGGREGHGLKSSWGRFYARPSVVADSRGGGGMEQTDKDW
jgi:hypothetical protein